MHDNATGIASYGGCAREAHGDHICPCLVSPAETKIGNQTDAKNSDAEGIGSDAWKVAIDCFFHGAFGSDAGAIFGAVMRHCVDG